MIGIVSITGHVLDDPEQQARVYHLVDDTFPGSGPLVRTNVEAVVQKRGELGVVSVIAMLWMAAAGFGAINRCVNRVWGAKRNHPMLLARPRAFLIAISVVVLFLASLAAALLAELLPVADLSLLDKVGIDLPDSARILAWMVSVFFMFLIYTLIYKVVPYTRPPWRFVLPGAVFATVLFEIGRTGFLLYLDKAANYAAVYGSIASIIVLIIWLWVSGMILILGAEFNILRAQDAGFGPATTDPAARSRQPELPANSL